MIKSITKLEKYLGTGRIKKNFDLSPYLTLRTHAHPQYFFEAETEEDLVAAKKASLNLRLAFFLLGGGSNLAILKKNLRGLVVRNKFIGKKIGSLDKNHVKLTVSSGYPITKLAKELAELGYQGLEYHLGLPGTVGGAIYMNSKWTKPLSYVGDNLISAKLLNAKGNVKIVDRAYFEFAYDRSILQKTNEIVLSADFKLKKTDPKNTLAHAKFSQRYRRETQPVGQFCSGCFFRNVNGVSAGKLIDQAGLKSKKVGQFHVSEKHANFIIHDGNGKPEDLKTLLKLMKTKVKDKFGVELKEEVILI